MTKYNIRTFLLGNGPTYLHRPTPFNPTTVPTSPRQRDTPSRSRMCFEGTQYFACLHVKSYVERDCQTSTRGAMFGYMCIPDKKSKTMVDKSLQCRTNEATQTQRRLDGLPPQFGTVQPLRAIFISRRIPAEQVPRTVCPMMTPVSFEK